MNNFNKNFLGFTIVELVVAITISVILLGGIFYFMSDTILSVSKSATQSKFLNDFYNFTSIFSSGEIEIIKDLDEVGYDVALLKNSSNDTGILIGVVDAQTLQLIPENKYNTYLDSVLGYRSVSGIEISQIEGNEDVIYSYEFFGDNLFTSFNIRDLQIAPYNSGSIVEMNLKISPFFSPSSVGTPWSEVPSDALFDYSLTF